MEKGGHFCFRKVYTNIHIYKIYIPCGLRNFATPIVTTEFRRYMTLPDLLGQWYGTNMFPTWSHPARGKILEWKIWTSRSTAECKDFEPHTPEFLGAVWRVYFKIFTVATSFGCSAWVMGLQPCGMRKRVGAQGSVPDDRPGSASEVVCQQNAQNEWNRPLEDPDINVLRWWWSSKSTILRGPWWNWLKLFSVQCSQLT